MCVCVCEVSRGIELSHRHAGHQPGLARDAQELHEHAGAYGRVARALAHESPRVGHGQRHTNGRERPGQGLARDRQHATRQQQRLGRSCCRRRRRRFSSQRCVVVIAARLPRGHTHIRAGQSAASHHRGHLAAHAQEHPGDTLARHLLAAARGHARLCARSHLHHLSRLSLHAAAARARRPNRRRHFILVLLVLLVNVTRRASGALRHARQQLSVDGLALLSHWRHHRRHIIIDNNIDNK